MSRITKEIPACMEAFTETGPDTISARFVFPAQFPGFEGHFPGRPILPGICLIQTVLTAAEKWVQQPVILQEIVRAKFFAPVTSNQQLTITCKREKTGDNQYLLKATVTGDDKKIAQLRLLVNY